MNNSRSDQPPRVTVTCGGFGMKLIPILSALLIVALSGCRTKYVEHPTVNLSPPEPAAITPTPSPASNR